MLQRVQQYHPASFTTIDLRGTLDIYNDWESEIDPTRKGFRKVAAHFVSDIRTRLPDIVHARVTEKLVL